MMQVFFKIMEEVASHFAMDWLYAFLETQSALIILLLAIAAVLGWFWLVRSGDALHGFVLDRLPPELTPIVTTPLITATVNGCEFKNIRVIRCEQAIVVAVARGSGHRFMVMDVDEMQIAGHGQQSRMSAGRYVVDLPTKHLVQLGYDFS
ncbi:MAG TPA: hypothetical protein PK402_04935 [Tepidisphaeraceae bacterium]|nr:hypothetical protein [Tepidisphaeraceae bacterium]